MKTIQAPQLISEFYDELAAELSRITKAPKYNAIRNYDVICVLAKMLGYCIGLCLPEERDLIKAKAEANIQLGIEDIEILTNIKVDFKPEKVN